MSAMSLFPRGDMSPGGTHIKLKPNYLPPIALVLIAISGLTLVLRFYAKLATKSARLGFDDWLIIPAYTGAILVTIITICNVNAGWNRHFSDITSEQYVNIFRWAFWFYIAITVTVALTKLSILISYNRFCNTKGFRWGIRIMMAFVASWGIAFVTVITFMCIPTSAFWSLTTTGKCLKNTGPIYLWHGLGVMIADVGILVLPIKTVLGLKVSNGRKMGLIFVFSSGILVCAASILRIWYSEKAFNTKDFTWYGYEFWTFTAFEVNLSIVCANLPSLRPLLAKVSEGNWSLRSKSSDLGSRSDWSKNGVVKVITFGSHSMSKGSVASTDTVAELEMKNHYHSSASVSTWSR